MVKKILIYLVCIIGVVLFFFFSFGLILVVAPGTEIFGIKYVSAVTGKYEQSIPNSSITCNVYIHAESVPINVSFAKSGVVGIEYVQHFQGFTKSSSTPEVKMLNANGEEWSQADGELHIYISEYKKFIWANSKQDFYFNINLPYYYSTASSLKSIYIDSVSSNVTFSGISEDLDTLSVNTSGSVAFSNEMTVHSLLKLNIKQQPNLSKVTVDGNIEANIPNASLNISSAVGGDISFTTKSGNLEFISCKNLTVISSSGNISKTNRGVVLGNANIQTNSGYIVLSSVGGSSNSIVSKTGKIDIGSCAGKLTISTSRADIVLGNVGSLSAKTTIGDITVGSATGDVSLETTSGNLSCGAVSGNLKTSTNSGSTIISGAIGGDADISSVSGNTKMVSANNLTYRGQTGGLWGYDNQKIQIAGLIDVSSGSGSITIGEVGGDTSSLANKISTTSGEISVGAVTGDIEASSQKGKITIASAASAYIIGGTGKVTLGAAINGATITTSSGSVTVGEDGNVGNLSITTKSGKIVAADTVGSINLSAGSGDIQLDNKLSEDITATGKKVTATGLMGKVTIKATGDVSATFAAISDKVRIDSTGSASTVVVRAESVPSGSITYYLNSQKGSNVRVYQRGVTIAESSGTIGSANAANDLIIISTYAKILVYLGEN